jgi:hypothetical protein
MFLLRPAMLNDNPPTVSLAGRLGLLDGENTRRLRKVTRITF